MPCEKIPLAINSKLKKTIRVKSAEEVDERFHSRYHAKGKKYRYVINNAPIESAIYKDFELHIAQKLDVEKIRQAMSYLIGEHDFASFKSSGTSSKDSVREIYKAEVIENGDRIYFEFTGSGFLYNMVRILSGTLLEVGLGNIAPEEMQNIINAKNRDLAGRTLPPQGLFLVEVYYK